MPVHNFFPVRCHNKIAVENQDRTNWAFLCQEIKTNQNELQLFQTFQTKTVVFLYEDLDHNVRAEVKNYHQI